jgi:hypothetical protein
MQLFVIRFRSIECRPVHLLRMRKVGFINKESVGMLRYTRI